MIGIAEQTAQAILDARTLYPNASLADLYDELAMPSEFPFPVFLQLPITIP